MQIRSRLTIRFVIIVASILLAALLFIYYQFQRHLQNEFYNNLRSKALLTAEMIVGQTSPSDFPVEINSTSYEEEGTDIQENISIYDRNNRRVFSHKPMQDLIPPATLKEIMIMDECRFNHNELAAFGQVFINQRGSTFIVVAESVFDSQYLQELARILVGVFFISIALVSAGGWYFAGQALAPVSRIVNQVDQILPSDLGKRLESGNQHDELARLVITFNKLLDRIQQAFNTQKLFLSNVSHELKNPLTVIISQIEIILGKSRDKEEYKKTLASVLEDMKELNTVSDKLMQLAKITAGDAAITFKRLRVDELVWQTKASLLKSHPGYKIHFEVANLPDEEDKLQTTGNELLLKTALMNLIENGCKFSPDQQVKVKLSYSDSGEIIIEIKDSGPGIPETDMPLVFEPFYRSTKTASVKGSGIGLSLVQSIAKLHDIKLKVVSRQGLGTTFTLHFPVAPAH